MVKLREWLVPPSRQEKINSKNNRAQGQSLSSRVAPVLGLLLSHLDVVFAVVVLCQGREKRRDKSFPTFLLLTFHSVNTRSVSLTSTFVSALRYSACAPCSVLVSLACTTRRTAHSSSFPPLHHYHEAGQSKQHHSPPALLSNIRRPNLRVVSRPCFVGQLLASLPPSWL